MQETDYKTNSAAYDILPPDIVQVILPFLSPKDIRSLSHTNKYFHKLLNYDSSETLWHELFHKAYGAPYSNDEPFQSKNTEEFKTCSEVIMTQKYPSLSWQQRFHIRTEDAKLYTWGCLKHARLGYTATSNSNLEESSLNGAGIRLRFGVNSPTIVPWFPKSGEHTDDRTIVQITSGGFSFQILTKSGKLYSTGSTFTGGHRGPGTAPTEHDYNPFREVIHNLETSFSRTGAFGVLPFNTTGTFPARRLQHNGATPTVGPHGDIYQQLQEMESKSTQTIPGNDHTRRMFTRDSFDIFSSDTSSLTVDREKLDSIKFISVLSGRSHFLALDENNDVYSWDSPESDYGVKLHFKGLPPRSTNPILKIGCGWDLNCVYIYKVGLVVWNKREAVKKGEICSDTDYAVIPNTGDISGPDKILDFACFQGSCVFYIRNDNKRLWKYSHGVVQPLELPIKGELLKVSVCFTLLVLFTNEYCYTLKIENGNIDEESLAKLELDDPDDQVISLATGDYHTLALTHKGHIYSWGLESQLCGCLGLGSPEHVVEHEHIGRWDSIRNIRVVKPAKIELDEDYTCVAVCAGGWQSGALIIKKIAT